MLCDVQEPCPAGTYMDELAAPTLATCKTCPTGYYCPQASVDPLDCPQGSYCPIQSGVPTPCPAGRYGNRTRKLPAVIKDGKNRDRHTDIKTERERGRQRLIQEMDLMFILIMQLKLTMFLK